MVRDGAALERAFELHPEYLQEARHGERLGATSPIAACN